MRLTALTIVLFTALTAAAQPAEQPQEHTTVLIPVAGNTLGANGVTWKTDLELHNDQSREVAISIELANPYNFYMLTLGPNETIRLPDVVGQIFGMESPPSPLLIKTSGRRSILIRASAYGVRGSETFPPHQISVNYRPAWYPTRALHGLAFSDDYRTNIGLANLGSNEAEFLLALQRISGRNVAVTRVKVPANSLWHFSVQSAFPLITKGDNFSVVVETSAPDTYVYGSVVENATNAARFIDPNISTPLSARR